MIAEPQGTISTFFDDMERERAAQEALLAAGGAVPLEDHWRWIREVEREPVGCLVYSHGAGPDVRAVVPVRRLATRSLPGHYRLRVKYLGHGIDASDGEAVLDGLRDLVDRESRHLGVNVEIFTPDSALREGLEERARAQGYQRVRPQRRYRWTARIDLDRPEDELFQNCSRSCRRAIREPGKKGFRVAELTDPRWVPRMEALWRATFERTGAEPPDRDWFRRVRFAAEHPELYRIVAAWDASYPTDESLVAFACGMNNGDHATYSDGASTRDIDSRIALSYAPVWDLIIWAKDQGCDWFDMGGVAGETREEVDDPTQGIYDFKRRFTDDLVEVGSEWSYQPASLRSWLSERLRRWGTSVMEVFGAR